MLTASNETAPMPTINTVTAIGSYSNQRNNMGKPLIFPDPIAMVILETRRECGDGGRHVQLSTASGGPQFHRNWTEAFQPSLRLPISNAQVRMSSDSDRANAMRALRMQSKWMVSACH